MAAHFRRLFDRQATGLGEDAIGNPDLADVVQRRELRQKLDALGGQVVAKAGMRRELAGEQTRVLLRAQ